MRRDAAGAGPERRWIAALAVFALLLQVLIPPGVMVGADRGGPALVICTGHGPLALDPQKAPDKAPRPGSGGVCAFAAHGVATPPPLAALIGAPTFAPIARDDPGRVDLAPGRGLAAPPPPSRGPPTTPL